MKFQLVNETREGVREQGNVASGRREDVTST